jgi:hypothetical protein
MIQNLYRKMQNKCPLTNEENGLICLFEEKYPLIRSLIFGDVLELYSMLGKDNKVNLSVDELKLLLSYHFGIEANNNTKRELIGELQNRIYQSHHFDSIKRGYTK